MKPTRIISKPYLQKRGGQYIKMLTLDDGNTYDLATVAEMIGMKKDGLNSRINYHGWDYPYILNPPAEKGKLITGESYKWKGFDGVGNEEWRKLSDVPRSMNLSRMKPLGTYERMIADREEQEWKK